MRRRWFWQDELTGTMSPGWAIAAISAVIVAFGLLVQWINDMHMYGYGLFAR